jgi:two-component system nitrogen regulation sensor histidine kinase NtrY
MLIEKLVNEFSDFARMPKPIFKKNDLNKLLKENVKLLSEIDSSIKLDFTSKKNHTILECDKEQINRVFFNLIKNSIESIQQKSDKNPDFNKKISIEILDNNDHIKITFIDNGIGFNNLNNRIDEIFTPYFTTKKNGTGLGLSIVNKIINDHGGEIKFYPINEGAKIEIDFNKKWQ